MVYMRMEKPGMERRKKNGDVKSAAKSALLVEGLEVKCEEERI